MTSLTAIPQPAAHQQTSDPQAAPASSTSTSRIALNAPADLAALRAAALQAARDRIDAHLPPSASTPDAPDLRAQVERSIDAWLASLFASVRANVDINGLPVDDDDDTIPDGDGAAFEAYDAPLAGRVVALHGQIEALQAELAGLRRAGAGEGAAAFRGAFAAWSDALEQSEQSELRELRERSSREADVDGDANADAQDKDALLRTPPFAGREAQLAARFEGAVQQVRRLGGGGADGGGVAGTAARAEEAVRVARYMA